MSTNVEPETDVQSIEYDPGLDTVVFTCNRYVTGDRFRTALTDDQLEWLQREFTPRIIEATIERSVQIMDRAREFVGG